jgi:hypothetical protein
MMCTCCVARRLESYGVRPLAPGEVHTCPFSPYSGLQMFSSMSATSVTQPALVSARAKGPSLLSCSGAVPSLLLKSRAHELAHTPSAIRPLSAPPPKGHVRPHPPVRFSNRLSLRIPGGSTRS